MEPSSDHAEVKIMFLSGQLLTGVRRLSVVSVVVCLGVPAVRAQSGISDVHIQPRVQPSVRESLGNISRNAIRTNVDLVLVPVTVTDTRNRIVVGLEPVNFQVYEGKQAQQIKHFSREDAPVSLGVILDVSGSMATKIERAREAVLKLLEASNPQDEFFLITFADTPQVVQDFTQTIADMQQQLLFARPMGSTALLDAIYLGLNQMKEAKYSRKALLLISDGGDNHSRYTEKEVKSRIKESDVLIYSVGVFDRHFATREELLGPGLLTEISEVTGAQCYTLDNLNDLPIITRHIGLELRNQYVLAYSPNNAKIDGKWRKIKVKLTLLPKTLPQLHVHAKTGYYGRPQ
jgi:Ca-activated chloride channel homolog